MLSNRKSIIAALFSVAFLIYSTSILSIVIYVKVFLGVASLADWLRTQFSVTIGMWIMLILLIILANFINNTDKGRK